VPILAQEPTIHPHDLLTSLSLVGESSDRVWWAVYTRSRQEKAVARELFRYQVPFYLPLIPSDRVVSGRRIRSFLPLFAGYIFVFGSDDERILTLKTNRISRILPVTDQEQLCGDLSQVRQLIASDAPLSVERRLQTGQKVRIKTGPFRDFEGTISRRHGRQRLVVAVSFLNQGVSVELEDAMVQPA